MCKKICIVNNMPEGNASLENFLPVFKARILKRCPNTVFVENETADQTVIISIDETIGKDGYRIESDGKKTSVIGSTDLGVLYGLGKLLRLADYADGFAAPVIVETFVPTSPFRGIQFDTHFGNFYHMAPEDELSTYVQDIILWGINYVDVVFPFIDFKDWDDPEMEKITGQIKIIYKTAKALGVKVGVEVVPNQDFIVFNEKIKGIPVPDDTKCRAYHGHNICPNKEGAMEYIRTKTYGKLFAYFKERDIVMDFLCFWPYDEGGCGCEKCYPWGARGYLKSSKAIYEIAKEYLPDVEVILSTWLFDTSGENEWEGLDKVLSESNDWVDYILADSRDAFPRYPLEQGVPGNLPLLSYPEISMWALYPWGGYGANPLPERFEMLWNQVKGHVAGGIPYSEGIFDDLNKIVTTAFFWNCDTTANDTVREYLNYEMGPAVHDDVREIIRIIEHNQTITAPGFTGKWANTKADVALAKQAVDLIAVVEAKLPDWAKNEWRWRMIAIRAELDYIRYQAAIDRRNDLTPDTLWTEMLSGSDRAKVLLTELVDIIHNDQDYDRSIHPTYHFVAPPLKDVFF